MKITEITLVPKNIEDTRSSATTSSAVIAGKTQDIVPQNLEPNTYFQLTKEYEFLRS